MLEDLSLRHAEGNRDYIYYLAIGNARLKNYTIALKYLRAFLQVEPNNMQVITLEVSSMFISDTYESPNILPTFTLLGTHQKEDGQRRYDWDRCGKWCSISVRRSGRYWNGNGTIKISFHFKNLIFVL